MLTPGRIEKIYRYQWPAFLMFVVSLAFFSLGVAMVRAAWADSSPGSGSMFFFGAMIGAICWFFVILAGIWSFLVGCSGLVIFWREEEFFHKTFNKKAISLAIFNTVMPILYLVVFYE